MDTCRVSATFTFAACLHGFAARCHVNTFHYASQSVHEIQGWLLWFPALLCCYNSETECTCPVCVLRRWWWLYSALGALVCISWQMGCSAPLLLPVMMSHVHAYQTGHTHNSPLICFCLNHSFVFLLSLFLTVCHMYRHFWFVPLVKIPLPRKERVHPYLQTPSSYICVHMQARNAALVARQLCSTLGESQDCASNMVQCVNYHPLLMRLASICPQR